MQATWKRLGTRMSKLPIRDNLPCPQASLFIIWWCVWYCGIAALQLVKQAFLLIIWWCGWRCGIGALQPVDALCVLHPSHYAPHSLFACSKPAPGDKTEGPLWPLIHTSSHKKLCFLLDIVTLEILTLPSPHRLILRCTLARGSVSHVFLVVLIIGMATYKVTFDGQNRGSVSRKKKTEICFM